MKRLFIVGNDAFIVHAMRLALRYSSGINLFGVIDGRRSVRDAVREAQPDIVVVDGLDDANAGIEHLREVREEAPNALVLLLSAPLEHPALHEVIEAGAMACIASASRAAGAPAAVATPVVATPVVEAAVEPPRAVTPPAPVTGTVAPADNEIRAAAERSPLTPRELEILRAVAEGHTNARIGRQLWVTEQTVKFHLSNIYRKLGVSNRTEASRYALLNGLVTVPRRLPGGAAAPDAQPKLARQAG
jgi:DNA-binding NarL/FixJ family response regulator